ncbi:beta-lactamase family protein [Streptomyces sp. NBC_01795]|uniref:serine hydrolase domain-containing protein n=1 Tax=Streptomyces sp. NBC_01795 TaxID=2975943 RepID=UPI002DDBBD2A|nr:serine hydrolase domain-containing protein [Streptomyces sp. NBC_01795]WSA94217.1 beta-lactamase family protein [Streptomyces sp. NBC_01795]
MTEVVQGTVADGYEAVRDAFIRNFEERGERGAALTVHRHGRTVVDLWGGTTDPADPEAPPWTADTAVVIRSATKGLAAAVPHLLHQRGQLDLDAPVGTYWPQFKAAGKERVLVRHLLSHRAGLPALPEPLTPEQALDGVTGPRTLAAQAPAWQPGTAHGYHAHTYGWLLAELVGRASGGRSLGRWFAEEIATPLGLDLWIGLPPHLAAADAPGGTQRVARVAEMTAPAPEPGALRLRPKRAVTDAYADPRSLTRRAFDALTPRPDENDPAYRAAELPAANGIGTARSLSAFYAALIGTGAGTDTGAGAGAGAGTRAGVSRGARRLFTPATLTQARSEESGGPDRVLIVNTSFGLGYMLHGSACPLLGPGSFGHPGRGGSLGFADPESGTSFGYVTNTLHRSVTSDPRTQALVRTLRTVVR